MLYRVRAEYFREYRLRPSRIISEVARLAKSDRLIDENYWTDNHAIAVHYVERHPDEKEIALT